MAIDKMLQFPDKFSSEKIVIGFDWSNLLKGKSITSVNFTVTGGTLTFVNKTKNGSVSKVGVEGGVSGQTNIITGSIILSDGTSYSEQAELKVK